MRDVGHGSGQDERKAAGFNAQSGSDCLKKSRLFTIPDLNLGVVCLKQLPEKNEADERD